ncbi:response regulator [Calothrix sp. 336/3]|uniref:response regulator n=1 Tax=Calothrix sp. 336/3 TaxID=1337936 RepID=UPI0004E42369|nr:response regulator [Calothrix sp. 336/3]AKG20294.1 chemotaxis protein CheY [Calothrix sp. 336/3]
MTAKLLAKQFHFQSYHRKKILLVEDNDINRMLMSDCLRYYEYDVQDLSAGSNCVTVVEKFKPQLILLDLKLPDVDGYVLLEQLHKLYNIPIIIVSAFAFKADQEKAKNLGAKRYFVKPVNLNELVMAIEEEIVCCQL